jgi:hypothetical protein
MFGLWFANFNFTHQKSNFVLLLFKPCFLIQTYVPTHPPMVLLTVLFVDGTMSLGVQARLQSKLSHLLFKSIGSTVYGC